MGASPLKFLGANTLMSEYAKSGVSPFASPLELQSEFNLREKGSARTL
jgi:hypothetical protein